MSYSKVFISLFPITGFLQTMYENGVNGILADERGFGKTVLCIVMLAHLIYQGVTVPFLVVAP